MPTSWPYNDTISGPTLCEVLRRFCRGLEDDVLCGDFPMSVVSPAICHHLANRLPVCSHSQNLLPLTSYPASYILSPVADRLLALSPKQTESPIFHRIQQACLVNSSTC